MILCPADVASRRGKGLKEISRVSTKSKYTPTRLENSNSSLAEQGLLMCQSPVPMAYVPVAYFNTFNSASHVPYYIGGVKKWCQTLISLTIFFNH